MSEPRTFFRNPSEDESIRYLHLMAGIGCVLIIFIALRPSGPAVSIVPRAFELGAALLLGASSLGISKRKRAVALLAVPAAGVMMLLQWLTPARIEWWVFLLILAVPAGVGWYWRRLGPPSDA